MSQTRHEHSQAAATDSPPAFRQAEPDRRAPPEEVYLHPGDWYFGEQPTHIRTLLGSCIAITLWHRILHIGGMCHYLLASRGQAHGALSSRYGDEAMLSLLRPLLLSGRPLGEFDVMLIGGASVLSNLEHGLSLEVPSRNIEMAHQLARQLGLRVKAEDLGGNRPRLVTLDLSSGGVHVQHTQESHSTLNTKAKI